MLISLNIDTILKCTTGNKRNTLLNYGHVVFELARWKYLGADSINNLDTKVWMVLSAQMVMKSSGDV